MSRSTTVGTPSVLTPPCGLGMSTRRTGRGRYAPASSASFTLGQCALSQSLSPTTVSPSTPGAPLFSTTRWYASRMLLRSTTASISRSPSDFVRPAAAVPTSAPEHALAGFRPAPASRASLARASASSVRIESRRSYSRYSTFRPSASPPTMPSADFWPSIPQPLDRGSTRQMARSPRVLRTHLHAYACRIYATAFRTSFGLCR